MIILIFGILAGSGEEDPTAKLSLADLSAWKDRNVALGMLFQLVWGHILIIGQKGASTCFHFCSNKKTD